MFAEELAGNASRKRQQENRARRRQLKNKQQTAKKNASSDSFKGAGTEVPSKHDKVSILPLEKPSSVATSLEAKPSAVDVALQQRMLRQENQQQQLAATKIQAAARRYRSNLNVFQTERLLLEKRLSDLKTLRTLLEQKGTKNYVPPPATSSALSQQVLFLTRATYIDKEKQRQCYVKIRDGKDIDLLIDVLSFLILPGLQTGDENLNPLLPWCQSPEGRFRLETTVRLCLLIATSRPTKPSYSSIYTFLRQAVGVSQQNGSTTNDPVVQICQPWMMNGRRPTIMALDKVLPPFTQFGNSMDIIQILRLHLLFSTGGENPIPASSSTLREASISQPEKARADALFQLVLDMVLFTRCTEAERRGLKTRILTEILTVPLVTWKISSTSISKLLSPDKSFSPVNSCTPGNKPVVLLSMITYFVDRYRAILSTGDIASTLPAVGVQLSQCPTTTTQSLLANLIALGRICPCINGFDQQQLDYQWAAVFFFFLATLVDAVPLGTFLSQDSVVEWVSDGNGHHTPVVLSPVVLDQCKLLLVDSFVRKLFNCAINLEYLKTDTILSTKTDKDVKHEKDLQEAGAGIVSAASLAANEVKVNRKSGWLSSKWAGKLKKGMKSFLSPTPKTTDVQTQTQLLPSGKKGVGLTNTSSESRKLASESQTSATFSATSTESLATKNQSYGPELLLALCRVYGILIARWGGGGNEDIVGGGEDVQRKVATSKPDPCVLSLLNVLCFSTDIVRSSWGLIQDDKTIISNLYEVIDESRDFIRSLKMRPIYASKHITEARQENDGAVLLYMFTCTLSHTLIITDDVEIHDMERPLQLHQLRRCIQLLKKLLHRACIGGDEVKGRGSTYFGLSLVSSSSRTMRDLYDRSSRRPLCVPALWLVENIMAKEIQRCSSHADYVKLLATPVMRICPFLVSFKRRLRLFERIVTTSRIEIQGVNDINPFNSNPLKPGIPVQITRGRVLEDGLLTLNKLGPNLRERINVQYMNQAGTREKGVDAGGLFKEFWTDLCGVAFNPDYALFRVTEDGKNCQYPNPSSVAAHGPDHVVLFEFLGRILGKALYEGITIHPKFAHFVLSFLRGDYNFLHMLPDLSTVDSQLYNNLMFLKTYDGDAEDLCLTFTVASDDFGGKREINLISNGANVAVTNGNKHRYIGLVAKHYVVDRVKIQSEAFTRGLWDVIDRSWLRIFNEPELQVLISGASDGNIDVDDMRKHTRYTGGFTGMELVVGRFWSVLASLDEKQKASLLRFVTSCERPPPLGFSSMNPPFTIQRVGILRDGDLLPSASTCFNTLKLPTYSSEKVMKQRLLYAIEAGAGFELT